MSRIWRAAIAAGLVMLGGRAAMGCAEGNETTRTSVEPPPDAAGDFDSAVTETGPGDGASTAEPTCSPDGWCYTKLPSLQSFDAGDIVPRPTGIDFSLTSVWTASLNEAWAVSATGHALRWDGTKWSVVFTTTSALRSVWGTSPTDIWLAGDAGLLLHGTGSPGALTFQPVTIASGANILRVWGTSATDVWLLADRVYHLAQDSSSFTPVTLPSGYGDVLTAMRISAVWGTATDTWFAGTERAACAPPSCLDVTRNLVVRRRVGADGAETWAAVPMQIDGATTVAGGVSAGDGVQLIAIRSKMFDTALAARIADDPSKLDPKYGAVTVVGSYAWSSEVAEDYGQPEGLWGRDPNELWLVGEFGVVRRFDGDRWQVARVARTSRAPLVNHLHGIDGIVGPSGERETWIVGDDVAMHRTVKP